MLELAALCVNVLAYVFNGMSERCLIPMSNRSLCSRAVFDWNGYVLLFLPCLSELCI